MNFGGLQSNYCITFSNKMIKFFFLVLRGVCEGGCHFLLASIRNSVSRQRASFDTRFKDPLPTPPEPVQLELFGGKKNIYVY